MGLKFSLVPLRNLKKGGFLAKWRGCRRNAGNGNGGTGDRDQWRQWRQTHRATWVPTDSTGFGAPPILPLPLVIRRVELMLDAHQTRGEAMVVVHPEEAKQFFMSVTTRRFPLMRPKRKALPLPFSLSGLIDTMSKAVVGFGITEYMFSFWAACDAWLENGSFSETWHDLVEKEREKWAKTKLVAPAPAPKMIEGCCFSKEYMEKVNVILVNTRKAPVKSSVSVAPKGKAIDGGEKSAEEAEISAEEEEKSGEKDEKSGEEEEESDSTEDPPSGDDD